MTRVAVIPKKRTILSVKAPEAQQVYLAGDFNGWDPQKHPMKKNRQGVWQKALMLKPGTYQYKFWMDGCWQHDGSNANQCPNCFGTLNNIITVKG
jgi:1,4-alpha-glucan branching enzyme